MKGALGFLDLPMTHSASRLTFRCTGCHGGCWFTDVKSRVGYPHSSSSSMKSAISEQPKTYTWVNRFPGRETRPVVYDLLVDDLHVHQMAILTAEERATTIEWVIQPKTKREQALLVSSAVGVVFKKSNTNFHRDDEMPGGQG